MTPQGSEYSLPSFGFCLCMGRLSWIDPVSGTQVCESNDEPGIIGAAGVW
jgi:hypothetical protein